MSFFYDLNKKLDSIRATPEVTHQQLNERDMGKHNNATTGFAALAKKTNPKIAGSQLKHMREKGQVEEGSPYKDYTPVDEPVAAPKSTASAPKPPPKPKPPKAVDDGIDESALQAAFGDQKYTHPGMIELQRLGREGASEKKMQATRDKFDQYDDKDDLNELSVNKLLRVKHDANKLARDERMSGGNADMAAKAERVAGKVGNQADDKTAADMKAQGTHAQPNLPEAGDTPAGLAAVRQVGQRADRALGDAGTGRSGSEIANPDKTRAARDRANAIQNRERIRANDKNPTRVVGGPNHGNQMEEDGLPMVRGPNGKMVPKFAADGRGNNDLKKTFADQIAGAKKEVDEMLGNVAADAMKKAIGGGRGRNAEMDEGHFDDTPTRRRSSSGGEIDTSKPGSTVHRQVKGNYSGAVHSGEERRAAAQADAADERGPRAGRRPVGAGNGTRIGAKINRGTSILVNKPAIGASSKPKSMTKENDQDPADQGEYGREGESSRNNIHTMMRNAKQLEKMLGNEDNLPEWVQEKLTLASDYMQTIADYLASERETDAEDETGMELAEKKSARSKPKQSSGNDGNLANNAKPYDKVTQGDVVAGRLGKDEMGGKKKSAKKEEEVEESTTAGSVATAPTSGKAGKGSMSFGKGIYDSIDRAIERQITESMNISMNMSTDDNGGPRQTLTITATDEDATQLAQMLKMAGLGGGDMSHGGEEVCPVCGMSNCGCGNMEQMDETYGDNVVDMNSPNYPTNTESAQDNFGYSGGLNKPKHDVAGDGQSTVPVTATRAQDELSRIREMAGMSPAKPVIGNKAAPINTSAQKAQQRQNESIFTDTENLWKRYKGQ